MRWIYRSIWLALLISGCSGNKHEPELADIDQRDTIQIKSATDVILKKPIEVVVVEKDITMKKYFTFLDTIVSKYLVLAGSGLGEYVLVHHNPWILDSLRSFDYYQQKAHGRFIYDLSQQIIFHQGDRIEIPDSISVARIIEKLKSTRIDLNIPEFRLRVIQEKDTVLSFPVRVGRNAEEYIEFVGRTVNLRTPRGTGEIVNVLRTPVLYNLKTGEKYEQTKRDDGRYTLMPVIPSLEPMINGMRYGNMFHATTNINTLGKAYSHGCIGMSEADAWSLYYHAPVGTRINFRYDLNIINAKGDTIQLRNIYKIDNKVN